jgi:uncharacterized surface protein with fasciclin (FAS1) repeats
MNKRLTAIVAAVSLSAFAAVPALAHQESMSGMSTHDPMVGGAPMSPAKNIVQNAVNSKDHTILVSLVKKAGLVETLEGPGPFTVFAPTNEAFEKIPKATLEAVGNDPATLKKVLTYHVVAGKLDSRAIADAIKAGGGKATFKTVEGESLTADMEDGKLVLTDAKGGKSIVTIPDVYQSNGVIHVINSVLMP